MRAEPPNLSISAVTRQTPGDLRFFRRLTGSETIFRVGGSSSGVVVGSTVFKSFSSIFRSVLRSSE